MEALRRALQSREQRAQAQSPAAQALTRAQLEQKAQALQYQSLIDSYNDKSPNFVIGLNQELREAHSKAMSKSNPICTLSDYKKLTSALKTYICASPSFTENYPLIGGQSLLDKRKGFSAEISKFIKTIQDLAQTHHFPEQSIEPLIQVATNAYNYQDKGQEFRRLLTESINLPGFFSISKDDGTGIAPRPTQATPNLDQFFNDLKAPLKRIEDLLNVIDIQLQR